MACPFCAIVAGEEDATIVDETDETIAFAPLDPVSEGHVLVVPKEHHETLVDMPDPTLHAVIDHAKSLTERLEAGHEGFDGVNLLHASGRAAQQSVPHFHLHLAPRRADDGLDLWPESSYDDSDAERTYRALQELLES